MARRPDRLDLTLRLDLDRAAIASPGQGSALIWAAMREVGGRPAECVTG
jgi:hypothetical protein